MDGGITAHAFPSPCGRPGFAGIGYFSMGAPTMLPHSVQEPS